ncbi:MAG: hypothetical protein STHCBS139747_006205 [Sporothrix thermara]
MTWDASFQPRRLWHPVDDGTLSANVEYFRALKTATIPAAHLLGDTGVRRACREAEEAMQHNIRVEAHRKLLALKRKEREAAALYNKDDDGEDKGKNGSNGNNSDNIDNSDHNHNNHNNDIDDDDDIEDEDDDEEDDDEEDDDEDDNIDMEGHKHNETDCCYWLNKVNV